MAEKASGYRTLVPDAAQDESRAKTLANSALARPVT
jgi:hypothetical protein